jgi:hypothetical protein
MANTYQIEKLKQYILNKMVEYAADRMFEMGYDETAVSKVQSRVVLYAKEMVETDLHPVTLQSRDLKTMVDDIIDYRIEKPHYTYDEDFPFNPDQKTLPPPDYNKAIMPGTRVSIEGLKHWVETVKINSDPILFAAKQADFMNVNTEDSYFDRAVDGAAYRVARKIYYVGRKDPNMTPEEWDALIRGKKPAQGSYSPNEVWTNGFPYGDDYEYRKGPQYEEVDQSTPFGKGWVEGGRE